MNVSGTTISATGHAKGLNDVLYDKAGARPDLDLDFARTKSLKDRVSKEDLITFTRASGTGYGATYVDENGLVKKSPVNWIFDSEDLSVGTYAVYSSFNGAVSANAGTSPSGNSSYAFIGTGVTGRYSLAIRPPIGNSNSSIPDNTRYVISLFIKRLTGASAERYVNLETANYSTWAHTGNSGRFDLENGTRVSGPQGSGAANITSGIEDVGDGWYRIYFSSITGTTDAATGFYLNGTNSISNGAPLITLTSSQGWLVWGVQVEEGSVPTTYIPTSAQRSGAPRFTHDPVTKESKGLLIEQSATNLVAFPRSSAGFWQTSKSTTDSNATNPDGSTPAYHNINTTENVNTFDATSANSDTLTFSVFIKERPGSTDHQLNCEIFKQINNPANNNAFGFVNLGICARFNVNTGEFVAVTESNNDRDVTNFVKEEYPNGWYRIGFTVKNKHIGEGSTGQPAPNNFDGVANTNPNFTSTARFDFQNTTAYLWGPQVEKGNVMTSYIPTNTTQVTRSPDLASIEGDNFGTYRTNLITNTSFRKNYDGWLNNNTTTLEPYAAASPFGTYDAGKLIATGGNNSQHQFRQNLTFEPSVKYNASVYVKAGSHKIGRLGLTWNDGMSNTFNVLSFNLNEGYVDSNNRPNQGFTTGTITSSSVTPVGNGWFRVQMVSATTASTIASANVAISFLDNSGGANFTANDENFFVWGLQVVKADTNSEFIPSTDTFDNRQANATYVDGNGIIKTSYANLFLNSEDFSQWTKGGTTVNSNFAIAPDGTQTADKITIDNVPASNTLLRQTVAHVINDTYTFSVWIKSSGSGSKFNMYATASNPDANLHTNLGIDATVGVTAPDEWTRYSITYTAAATGNYSVGFNNGPNGPDDYVSEFLVWGAQLVRGSDQPEDYYKTTDTISGPPRYSHDSETLSPTGLYLEPEATNISAPNVFHFPEDIGVRIHYNTIAEQKAGQNTDGVVGPDGTAIGVGRMFFTGTETDPSTDAYVSARDNTPGAQVQTTFPNDNSYIYTSSVFIKPGLETEWKLRAHSTYASASAQGTGENIQCRYLLTGNGTVSGLDSDAIDATVQKYPNGWYRCSITYYRNNTAPVSTVQAVRIYADSYSNYNVNSETGTIGWFWGPQVETGLIATSYIPTSGREVTRNADIFTSTATEVLDRANGTKPAFYKKGNKVDNSGISFYTEAKYNASSHTNIANFSRILQLKRDNDLVLGVYKHNNQIQVIGSNPTEAPLFTQRGFNLGSGDLQIGVRYAEDDSRVYLNFNKSFSNRQGSLDGDVHTEKPTDLYIGNNGSSGGFMNGTIKRLTFWKTPFTDSKLDKFTS